MRPFDRVTFQWPNGTKSHAWFAWAGQTIVVLLVEKRNHLTAEVACQLSGRRLFGPAVGYTLNKIDADMLRTCQEIAAIRKGHMSIRPIPQVLYLRSDNRRTAPAFVLCENGENTLLYVWCRSTVRSDFIAIAQDDNKDGIYEDAELRWLHVTPEQTMRIAGLLKWIGPRAK